MRTATVTAALGSVVAALAALAAPARAEPPARERRLHLASAEASSYLVNDWNKFQENYLPQYVGDDDPRTAWTLKTEGVGEWLRVHVTPMAGATKVRLQVRNGYQKSDKLWAANSRARGLTVVLLPSKRAVDVDLKDQSGWQEVVVEQPAGPLDAVELRVRSVYAGKKYDDLCLSDVQVFVTATSPDNPAFEKQRLQKLADWKKERLAAAKLFQTKLGQALPIAAQYVMTPGQPQGPPWPEPCRDQLCSMARALDAAAKLGADAPAGVAAASALAKAGFTGLTPVRLATRDKRPVPAIDGVCTPTLDACAEDPCYAAIPLPPQLGYLNADTLVATEQSGLPALRDVLDLEPPQCRRAAPTTFAYVARGEAGADGAPGPIRLALLATCGQVDGREGPYPTVRPQLLVYGPDGWLQGVTHGEDLTALRWSRGAGEPKLASARTTAPSLREPARFEAATAVAAQR